MKFIHDIAHSELEPCVATIGFFDGVHIGHRFLIDQVKRLATEKELKSLLITFDTHPRQQSNPHWTPLLLTTNQEKKDLLVSTGADYCLVLDFTPKVSHLSAKEFMEQVLKRYLNVKILLIGYDNRFGHNREENFDDYVRYGKEIGIDVIRFTAYSIDGINVSSSVIRNYLQHGAIEEANLRLGYEYFLDGVVVGGYRVGRTIGFPTANLQIDNKLKLIPQDGVYAVHLYLKGKQYIGMLNIGYRPTFNNVHQKTIEVHILDFSSDIYNSSIRISFIKKIRGVKKFTSVEELIEQLRMDEKEVRVLLNS